MVSRKTTALYDTDNPETPLGELISNPLAKETNGNGTSTTYSYDLAGQLVSLVNVQADGTINSRFDYTYKFI